MRTAVGVEGAAADMAMGVVSAERDDGSEGEASRTEGETGLLHFSSSSSSAAPGKPVHQLSQRPSPAAFLSFFCFLVLRFLRLLVAFLLALLAERGRGGGRPSR